MRNFWKFVCNMIRFDDKNRVFYLDTVKTTYAIGIFNGLLPVHIYYGKKINRVPDNWSENYSMRAGVADDFNGNSSDILPQEYPTFGSDLRIPALQILSKKFGGYVKLKYEKYEIVDGKPKIDGLPATYIENDGEAQTLKIYLKDDVLNIDVVLFYSVFSGFNAITRYVSVINNGENLYLNGIMSASIDFFGYKDCEIVTLDGSWQRERGITRRAIVSGNLNVESRCGVSGAYHNPFMAICDKGANENTGNVYGFSLVYSGDFVAGVECNAYNTVRAYIGINPFDFSYLLNSGETFYTPETVLVYSDEGFGKMSRIYHKFYRTRLCRGKYRDTSRFVLINNWETTCFDFDEEKIVNIAKKASEIGVDTMVLDDGWFGKRISDNAGLGDWIENPDRLPNGLSGLAEKVNALGMRFGLWFEPEMVNPDSDLYRAHPDWTLHIAGRKSSLSRNQLTLDLSRKDVCEYIVDAVANVLKKANIEYVKWDFNRYMSEVGSSLLPTNRQGEVRHRYILGLYNILETLTQQFPNVLFESCASGGGRFDPGMLYYMPQTWTSDDTDAIERLRIQYGTSIVYPFSAMGAHVSACPNLQIGRTTSFEMRCNVAMQGQLGFELDLNKCNEQEIETARCTIEKYHKLERVFHQGDCYRLRSPFETDLSILEFVSQDKNTAVICINSQKATCYSGEETIKLEGLKSHSQYEMCGIKYDSEYLMNSGIVIRNDRENKSEMLVLSLIEM